jgi:hypothetical protein
MQLALRPYATAGVALVGVSVIAVSPVAVPPTAVEQIRESAVELSALANPIDAFRPVFEATVADLQQLGQVIGADPTPILAQIIQNQINGVGNIGAALEAQIGVVPQLPQLLGHAVASQLGTLGDLAGVGEAFVNSLTDVLLGTGDGTVQDQLQRALDSLKQEDFGQAFQLLAVLPLLPVLGNGLSNIALLTPLIAALQQPLADAAELFPIAAGPLANAQAALGVLGNPLNALVLGIGALTAITGVADAAGNAVGGLIGAAQNRDPEAAFNTIVTESAAGVRAVVDGVLSPQLGGLVAGLQSLREAIAAAITTPSFPPPAAITEVAKAPSGAAQSFALTTTQEKAPESKAGTPSGDEKTGSAADDTTATAKGGTETTTLPDSKDGAKGGNLFTPSNTSTKGGRHRADTGSFAQGVRDTIKGLTGLGREKTSESSSTSSKSGESASGSSSSDSTGSGGSSGSK